VWPRFGSLARPAFLSLALLAACGGTRSLPRPHPWHDLLARLEAQSLASRTNEGVEAIVPGNRQPAVLTLEEAAATPFRLEAELLWKPEGGKATGGFQLVVGPHVFGSRGFCIAAAEQPPTFTDARWPRLPPGRWHRLEVRVGQSAVELALDGRLVARSPAAVAPSLPVEVAIQPGTRLLARSLRLWKASPAPPLPGRKPRTLLVFPPDSSPHTGRMVSDAAAGSQRALEVRGAGVEVPVVWGHDVSLGVGGTCLARFHLRGVGGTGELRLAVVRANGEVLAERAARLEELPADSYRAIGLEFRCEPGWVVSFEVTSEGGVFRLGDVVVSSEGPGTRAGRSGGPVERPRRARKLSEVWNPQIAVPSAVEFVRLERRLRDSGDYEFRALWRLRGSDSADDIAIDMWVATRDEWGLVRVFDRAAAYDRVGPGDHNTTALMPARVARLYGSPVAFFAMLYREGRPVAAAWRKWGIPVEDKYIVGARRVGALRRSSLTE